MQEFYKKQVEVYNMFLGENGVEKILNGRQLSWSTFDEIDAIIKTYISPKLKVNASNIKDKIENGRRDIKILMRHFIFSIKYNNKQQRDDVIE